MLTFISETFHAAKAVKKRFNKCARTSKLIRKCNDLWNVVPKCKKEIWTISFIMSKEINMVRVQGRVRLIHQQITLEETKDQCRKTYGLTRSWMSYNSSLRGDHKNSISSRNVDRNYKYFKSQYLILKTILNPALYSLLLRNI